MNLKLTLLLPFVAFSLAGCSGPKVHAVRGQVIVENGEIQPLVNGHVELVSEADDEVRASGKIDADGRFRVQSQIDGKLLNGAPPGSYRARVILPQGGDDTDEPRAKRSGPRVHARYLNFKTSGFTVDVPAKEDVTLTVQTTD